MDVGYDIRLVGIMPKERRWKKKKETDAYGNEQASDQEENFDLAKWDPMQDSAEEITDDEVEEGSEEEHSDDEAANEMKESEYETRKSEDEYEGGV